MGSDASKCDNMVIANIAARSFYEVLNKLYADLPDTVKKQKNVERTIESIHDSLKSVPNTEKEFGLKLSGLGIGATFLNTFVLKIDFPKTLTKISLRKSGLDASSVKPIAKLMMRLPQLKQLDASENDFGENAVILVRSAIGHPSIKSLQMEDCKLSSKIVEDIQNLLLYSRKLETLRLSPVKVPSDAQKKLSGVIKSNRHVTNLSVSSSLDVVSSALTDRNSFIFEFVDSIARSPFQRQFRTKIDAFKSVKGREMLMGRATQKEKARGTDLFARLEQVDQRARTTEAIETVERIDKLRSGHAEMVGRRPNMEDVSIVLSDAPNPKSSMFCLFDGHGGREAAEFASQNLPDAIKQCLAKGDSPVDAYTNAFKKLQIDMKTWCVYVGCTACVAAIENKTLTVANIGDTRCVLCRDGKAIRLTVDHKPDLPEETAYIQSKGGFVRDARVGGMLAVSRAFGDGFLGDSVNPTPYFVQEQLTPKDQFLILACDGVWDVINDQKACEIVLSEIDPLTAAKKLRDTAFELESTDNISVIVVSLSELSME